MDSTSLSDFRGGEGIYVADALERSLLLPTDMVELGGLRRQEVFLGIKRYLGIVRLSILVVLTILVFGSLLTMCLFQLAGCPGYL